MKNNNAPPAPLLRLPSLLLLLPSSSYTSARIYAGTTCRRPLPRRCPPTVRCAAVPWGRRGGGRRERAGGEEHNEIQTETSRKSGEDVRSLRILFASGRSIRKRARDVCTGAIVYRLHLQAITRYRSNYPVVTGRRALRWHPIIKVETNTSDLIKSELIVIKRNGASAGQVPPLLSLSPSLSVSFTRTHAHIHTYSAHARAIFHGYNWRSDVGWMPDRVVASCEREANRKIDRNENRKERKKSE